MRILPILCFILTLPPARAEEPPEKKKEPNSSFLERIFSKPKGQVSTTGSATGETGKQVPWDLYPAGKLPPGKVLNEAGAAKLQEGDYTGKTTYLTGTFVVTAKGQNREVLRYVATLTTPIRVIVEYPAGFPLPPKGTRFTLDHSNGLLLRSAKRSQDNSRTLNLYVRRITELEK